MSRSPVLSPRTLGQGRLSPVSPRRSIPSSSPISQVYVPSDVRQHIQGFIPSEHAGYGARALAIDKAALIDEMLELGLDPAAIIANERLRQREERRRQASPARQLYLALVESEDAQVTKGEEDLYVETSRGYLADVIRQLGLVVEEYRSGGGVYPFSLIVRGGAYLYPELVRYELEHRRQGALRSVYPGEEEEEHYAPQALYFYLRQR